MADLVLAIDQGTTNTKALVVDTQGHIVAQAARPMTVHYPRPGWAEQSAAHIWQSVCAAIGAALRAVDVGRIGALAISNQRESVVLWDRDTGQPLGPCIIWQCRRSAPLCDTLRQQGHEAEIAARSGLGLDPLFPAAKIAWLLDHVDGARSLAAAGRLAVGTVDSWLLWNFTAGAVHACDHSNASRTQLFNIHELAWDGALLDFFGVPDSLLPTVRPSDSRFGETAPGLPDIPANLPIHAMMGDSHAALFAHALGKPGTVKATYGTGSSLMTLTDGPRISNFGLSSTIAWSRGERVYHALEGNISVSAQAAAFVAKMLGLADVAALSDLASTVPDNGGVTVVPALAGLGAPHWNADARGSISGLSLGSQPGHVARATLEAIALQIADVFTAMETDLGRRLERLSADGGATQNKLLMQIQADLLGRPVDPSAVAEMSALGAALMAGIAAGLWAEDQLQANSVASSFAPGLAEDQRQSVLAQWQQALRQVTAA
jgi:glycerol kinase